MNVLKMTDNEVYTLGIEALAGYAESGIISTGSKVTNMELTFRLIAKYYMQLY